MEDKTVVAIAAAVYLMKTAKKRKARSIWVKPYLTERREKSNFQLVNELQRLQDKEEYRAYLRMDTTSFIVSNYFLFLFLYLYHIATSNL